jgi:GxxExxY protein
MSGRQRPLARDGSRSINRRERRERGDIQAGKIHRRGRGERRGNCERKTIPPRRQRSRRTQGYLGKVIFTAEDAGNAEMIGEVNKITRRIIDAAIAVHRELGPGLLESTYEACLAYELVERGMKVEPQKALPVKYRDVRLDCGYRIDLLVEESIIVELKSVEHLEPIHQAQLLSYLKLSGCKVGLLINFNVNMLKNGIKRLVNGLAD